MNKKNPGFTLIEIVVVMSIIAIIISISLFAITAAKRKGNIDKAQADMAALESKIEVKRNQIKKTMREYRDGPPPGYINPCTDTSTICISPWLFYEVIPNPIDPWGKEYIFIERENKTDAPSCRKDVIVSGGPDSQLNPPFEANDANDLVHEIRFYSRACEATP